MMDLTHVQFQGRPAIRPRETRRPILWGTTQRSGNSLGAERLAPPVVSGLPAFVLACVGLDPAVYREGPLKRRTGACLRAVRAESDLLARARLEAHPELRGLALNMLLIGVSGFFRDTVVFETLRTTVIPALGERSGPIRIWSLGCSTGAELYSVGIMLAEAGLLHRAHLLGSDCRTDAVTEARTGVFPEEALTEIDPAILARYFERTRSGWRVADALRQRTHWQAADATRELAAGPWDMVLCRNVVIYLQSSVGETLFGRLAERLTPGGFLVVGKAERPPVSLRLTAVGRCIHQSHVDR